MKKSACKAGKLAGNLKEECVGEWIYVNSIDDFFKLSVDIDFSKLYFATLVLNICYCQDEIA